MQKVDMNAATNVDAKQLENSLNTKMLEPDD